MKPAEIVAIAVEEAEKRGDVEQKLKDLKQSIAEMTVDLWTAVGGCPCCETYADHMRLCQLILEALENKQLQS